jgi:hypothetical protein
MWDVTNLLFLDNTYTAVGLRTASEGCIALIVHAIAMAAPESHLELKNDGFLVHLATFASTDGKLTML